MNYLQKTGLLAVVISVLASFNAIGMESTKPSSLGQREALIFGAGIGFGAACMGGYWMYQSITNRLEQQGQQNKHNAHRLDQLETRVMDNEKHLVETAKRAIKTQNKLAENSGRIRGLELKNYKYHSLSSSSSSTEERLA